MLWKLVGTSDYLGLGVPTIVRTFTDSQPGGATWADDGQIYFVETSAKQAEPLLKPPLSATFIHRQTMANQVRFTTVELSELEQKIVSAADRALAREQAHFETLGAAVLACALVEPSRVAGCPPESKLLAAHARPAAGPSAGTGRRSHAARRAPSPVSR